MKKFSCFIVMLLMFQAQWHAQNISGVINHYARVTGISGQNIVATTTVGFNSGDRAMIIQMKGATIAMPNDSTFGDILSLGGAGTFEFIDLQAVSGNTITAASPLTNTYAIPGFVQLVRVPRYCSPTVSGSLTSAAWNGTTATGGVLALEAGTLILNTDINVNGKGFRGGRLVLSSFACDDSSYVGSAGLGGQKGESISGYIAGSNGFRGKQANGGGGGNPGNSGGGGGANAGSGGFGGHQWSGCGIFDVRGIGGTNLSQSLSRLFLGGGGGGGFQDNNNTSSDGGTGGGIIYIRANVIIANNHLITANGESVTVIADAEGTGGGGGGGSIVLQCGAVNGNLKVTTHGGSGGDNYNTMFPGDCHGTGGGGGGGFFVISQSPIPGNITYSSLGGAAGMVQNPNSLCYSTTNGATDGTNGLSLTIPAFIPLNLNTTNLSISQSVTICRGESIDLTASGAGYYLWNTGATASQVAVSPTVLTHYTVTASDGPGSCQTSAKTSVSVTVCDGIIEFASQDPSVYPNPTNGQVIVDANSPIHLMVYDETGRLLATEDYARGKHFVSLEKYSAGIYTFKLTSSKELRIVRVVKTP